MTAHQPTNKTIIARPLADHGDFMRVRQFLIDTYALYGSYFNWEIRRWEGQWYWGLPGDERDVINYTRLYETASGDLVGAVHIEGSQPGNAWIEIHPDYRHIEPEMIDFAEANLARINDDGTRHLDWFVYDEDTLRRDLLAQRGYTEDTNHWGVQLGGLLSTMLERIPDETTPPPGYVIRAMQPGEQDAAHWANATGKVFGHTTDVQAILTFQQSPSYDHNLHIIAQAPDGTFAAFAGLTVDPTNRTAIFEPVGTHPDHRRRKLASLVMWEGMRRLQARGDIDRVVLDTGDAVPANRLYDALGFKDNRRTHRWHKTW